MKKISILEIKLEILRINVLGLSLKEELCNLFNGHIRSTLLSEEFKVTLVNLLMAEGHKFHVPPHQLFIVFDKLIDIRNVYIDVKGGMGHFVFLFSLPVEDIHYIEKFYLYFEKIIFILKKIFICVV